MWLKLRLGVWVWLYNRMENECKSKHILTKIETSVCVCVCVHGLHPLAVFCSSSWSPQLTGLTVEEGQGTLSRILDHGDPPH